MKYKYPSTRSALGHWLQFQKDHYKKGILPSWKARVLEKLPEWDKFIFFRTAVANRMILLDLAKRGCPKLIATTVLGRRLAAYTTPGRNYNATFDNEIRAARQDWFIDKVTEKKKAILKIARKGDPKIPVKHPLHGAFYSYFYKSSACYDPKFEKAIRATAWFK